MNPVPPPGRRFAGQNSIPRPPPLPAPRPLQRARDAASRFFNYSGSRPPSPHSDRDYDEDRFTHGSSQFTRSSSLGSNNATASHRTGLEIRTISINESGTHAIIAGKDIFKTLRVEDGHCTEDLNLRTAIRSTPTSASGQPRQTYEIDIADVAWAKGDSGDYVAAATSSGKIIVYDIAHAALQAAQLHEHYRQVHNITFNPHKGNLLLSGSQDGTVRLWDLRDLRNQPKTIQSKRKFSGQSEGVRDVKWSPTEGCDFAFGTENGEIQRWDMRYLNKPKVRVPAHGTACNTVDWHPDGKHILSAGTDKTVRVFDVSVNRPKKAAWEIKTPHPVMLARWRPSCQSAMPTDNGAQQCTQIATAYDRTHPVMHVWDFRRPLLPFRELCPHPGESPKDMLWHSQDLLWTVGDKTFLQTDIQHTSKVIDRYNLQSLDVSPLGELTFFAQTRRNRRLPKSHSAPTLHPGASSSLSTSPESAFLSRSWADDSIDHAFLSVLPFKRSPRSKSNSRVHGASGSSTYNGNQSATIKLDDILLNRKSFRPQQVACRGQLHSHNSLEYVSFIAKKSQREVSRTVHDDDDFLLEVEKAFKLNEDHATSVGLLQTAQTWKMVSFCALSHLRERLSLKRKRVTERKAHSPPGFMGSSIENLATRFAVQHLKSPAHSPGTLRPLSNLAQQLTMPESTSNVPTPLARPSSAGVDPVQHVNSRRSALPDPDKGEKITLPPSLTSQNGSVLPVPEETAPTSRRLTAGNLEDLQRLALGKEPDRIDMVKRWNTQPKVPLSLDPVDADGIKIPPAKLEHHGSGESFQFLEESTGSRGSSFPASLDSQDSPTLKRMVAKHPSRTKILPKSASFEASTADIEDTSNLVQSMFFEGSGTLANSAAQTKESSGNTSLEASDEDLKERPSTDSTDFAFNKTDAHSAVGHQSRRPETPVSVLAAALKRPEVFTPRRDMTGATYKEPEKRISGQVIKSMAFDTEAHSPIDSVLDDEERDLELNKPWTLISMLQQLLQHYSASQPYPQMASLLVLLLGPLLPQTHPLPAREVHQTISIYVEYFLNHLNWDPSDLPSLIKYAFEQPIKAGLQPLQVESILSTYHEQLLAYQLFDEAAVLRRLAYPAYPAVYEDFIKDNSVHLMCGSCNRALEGTSLCKKCRDLDRRACPVCWEPSSPFEQNGAGKLLSSCLLCGHGGHKACLHEWFVASSGDGCPTEGCLCDCVAGSWREQREASDSQGRGHERVKSDEWMARESKAVEGARELV